MRDTRGTSADRDELHSQVERLNRSAILHGSESLCKLLRYLADRSLESPGTPVKEYQIATEVFGRPADFDPRLDSTVRVQTGRLRSKLAEYYAADGVADRVVIEIPKGSYSLIWRNRTPAETAPPTQVAVPAPVEPPPPPKSGYPLSWFVISIAVGTAVLLLGSVITRLLTPAQPTAASTDQPQPALQAFWNGFATGPEAPLVVYSNAEFVGRPETGLRYYNAGVDRGRQILDHYTGVGEVMAVHELDRVFASLRRPLHIKRGRLLTWDDAKASDLIFVGSPSENLSLRELPGTQDFVFARKPEEPRKGDLTITNLHPGPGEGVTYMASETPITEDYGLVALTSGLNQNRRVLILAGITTFGTQAAVEFVSRSGRIEELLSKLGAGSARPIAPFEALLKVKVSGGVPVHSELLSVHLHPAAKDNQ